MLSSPGQQGPPPYIVKFSGTYERISMKCSGISLDSYNWEGVVGGVYQVRFCANLIRPVIRLIRPISLLIVFSNLDLVASSF